MDKPAAAADLERRKQVRIRLRGDLAIEPQKFEGKTYFVVKDPVSLRYYRFKEQEQFLLQFMDGQRTLDEAQKQYEKRFRPERLTLEDLESFAQQLLTAGLAQNESPKAGTQLFQRRKKRLRKEWLQTLTNILYIKIPIIDPEWILQWMIGGRSKRASFFRRADYPLWPLDWLMAKFVLWPLGWVVEKVTFGAGLGWMFSTWFLLLSFGFMLGVVLFVAMHFDTFWEKWPELHQLLTFHNVVAMWIALGMVKVIHEFGHGLSCKAFGGEVHEMGALFLCFSPCLYANVSDAWTLPNKWHRIVISAAGIYVEFMIACAAAIVWWNTPTSPLINGLALNLMVVCSVSTFFFNANPLMRYDGYYVLADWLEIPNLRDRANRYLKNVVLEHCLGVEVQPEPYMALVRRVGFVFYAIVSWIYRWVVTFSILVFMGTFLKPYNLQVVSQFLAVAAAGSLFGWPLYNLGKSLYKRGRLPDMKQTRVTVSAVIVGAVVLFFFFVPLPVSRVSEAGVVQVQPSALSRVYLHVPSSCILEQMNVRDGEFVEKDQELAVFSSRDLDSQLLEAGTQYSISVEQLKALQRQFDTTFDTAEQQRIKKTISEKVGERDSWYEQMEFYRKTKDFLVLKAPRAGVVMSPPKIDEIGKLWEKDQSVPFCSIGDHAQLRVLVPVGPAEYRLLDEDLHSLRLKRGEDAVLEARIRIQGRSSDTWAGTVIQLPESEAKDIPLHLSNKAGGPVAVRPSGSNDKLVPLTQQYLVSVAFKDPDRAIAPGTMARVKIHCRWRTCAWWVWRKLSSTFDLGLL